MFSLSWMREGRLGEGERESEMRGMRWKVHLSILSWGLLGLDSTTSPLTNVWSCMPFILGFLSSIPPHVHGFGFGFPWWFGGLGEVEPPPHFWPMHALHLSFWFSQGGNMPSTWHTHLIPTVLVGWFYLGGLVVSMRWNHPLDSLIFYVTHPM